MDVIRYLQQPDVNVLENGWITFQSLFWPFFFQEKKLARVWGLGMITGYSGMPRVGQCTGWDPATDLVCAYAGMFIHHWRHAPS